MIETSLAVSQAALGLAALLAIWFGPVYALKVDDYRSAIRRIRDDLFDYMADSGYDFREPAYRDVRQTLNGMIRIAQAVSLTQFVVMVLIGPAPAPRSTTVVDRIKAVDDPRLRERLSQAVRDANIELIRFLVGSSLVVTVVVRPVVLVVAWLVTGVHRTYRRSIIESVSQYPAVRDRSRDIIETAYELGPADPPRFARQLIGV